MSLASQTDRGQGQATEQAARGAGTEQTRLLIGAIR